MDLSAFHKGIKQSFNPSVITFSINTENSMNCCAYSIKYNMTHLHFTQCSFYNYCTSHIIYFSDTRGIGELWLGLSDRDLRGTYRYTDGTYPQWVEWQSGSPQEGNGECVFRNSAGKLQDTDCNQVKSVMCELAVGKLTFHTKTTDFISTFVYLSFACNNLF